MSWFAWDSPCHPDIINPDIISICAAEMSTNPDVIISSIPFPSQRVWLGKKLLWKK